jgi:hypothetical protein
MGRGIEMRLKRLWANEHIRRVASSYFRMGLGFVVGIMLIRYLLGYGEGVFAAFTLTASSIGVAEILKEAIRGASIPELGIAYHSNDDERFKSAFASSLFLSIVAGLFAVIVLGLFILSLDYFEIEPQLKTATAIFIATRMALVFVTIAASPVINLLPITGRMVQYNFWLAMDRVVELLALILASYTAAVGDGAGLLVAFGIYSMVAMIVASVGAATHGLRGTNVLPIRRSHFRGRRMKEVLSSVGWQGAAVTSVTLYLRFDVFAVNILFGVAATVIFSMAGQLAAYTKQITMGLVTGLDAVVSKKSALSDASGRAEIIALNNGTLHLQSLFLFSTGVVLLLHAELVISFLFGDRLTAPDTQVPLIAQCFVMLMVGMIARGLSEGWMSILAGSNRIRDYAQPVLLGACLNPVLVYVTAKLLTPETGPLGISTIFMLLNVAFHLMVVPYVTARFLGISFLELIRPGIGPMLLAIVAGLLACSAGRLIPSDVHKFILTCILIGIVFLPWVLLKFGSYFKRS